MVIFYFLIFVLGLGFGSFSSVIIHRLRTGKKGILAGRSMCPKCKHTLSADDLVPLVSYLVNRGKCRYCHKKISIRYPLLELAMGSFFVLTTLMTGFHNPWLLGYHLFLTFIFVLLSAYDIFYQEVPDVISLPTIIITGIVGGFSGLFNASELWIGFLVPVLFFGTLFVGSKGRWLGGGDVRIGGIMGFTLGWPNILVGLFMGYLIGAAFSVIGLATKKLSRKSMIPFGPFLFLGTYIAMFWGQEIIEWYVSGSFFY